MLELYHHGSSVCAAKVRFALAEKGVHVDGMHYIDILKGEQFSADYLKINPKAVVPSLVHDGRIINESTVICEYVNDAFAGAPLIPDDAFARVRMRLWTKAVDEQLHPACGELTFVCCHRHIVMRLPKAELQAFLASTPDESVTSTWRERKKEIVRMGFDAPGVDTTIRLYDSHLTRMEEALKDGPWLAGERFSLADIALAPYVNRLDMLNMAGMWENGRLPRVSDWFARIKATPNFKAVFLDWCPEELTNDLRTFGAQSWPDVKRIIGMERG
ncbi:MAG: glutathione S-transferase family protein [Caulobacterales bacterium]|nr:glutathione S-transferase family protein [Caulobacterales bacterium]